MKNASGHFTQTNSGYTHAIPEHITELDLDKNQHIATAIRIIIENINDTINVNGRITSPTPDFIAITLWDRYGVTNGVIQDTQEHLYLNAIVGELQDRLGDNCSADNATNLKTTFVAFKPLKEALMEMSREYLSPEKILSVVEHLQSAENLDRRYKAHTKTALPRPV